MMIEILLADSHGDARESLKNIIEQVPDMKVVNEAKNFHDLMDRVRTRIWDVVVLDCNMPNRFGIEILKAMKSLQPRLPILVYSIYPEEHYAVRALKAGANCYVSQHCSDKLLIKLIREVAYGGKCITAALAEKLAFYLEKDFPQHDVLSDREYEILYKMA